MNVGCISLGCSKNLVDTEMTIGLFKNHNYNTVTTPVNADVIVINTCGFIASAKEEAINTILEMANYKKNRCKYLIVMGCLVQRYKEDLEKAIPEVDLWIKYNEYNTIWEQIENVIAPLDKSNNYNCPEELNFLDRVVSTGKNYAYLSPQHAVLPGLHRRAEEAAQVPDHEPGCLHRLLFQRHPGAHRGRPDLQAPRRQHLQDPG